MSTTALPALRGTVVEITAFDSLTGPIGDVLIALEAGQTADLAGEATTVTTDGELLRCQLRDAGVARAVDTLQVGDMVQVSARTRGYCTRAGQRFLLQEGGSGCPRPMASLHAVCA